MEPRNFPLGILIESLILILTLLITEIICKMQHIALIILRLFLLVGNSLRNGYFNFFKTTIACIQSAVCGFKISHTSVEVFFLPIFTVIMTLLLRWQRLVIDNSTLLWIMLAFYKLNSHCKPRTPCTFFFLFVVSSVHLERFLFLSRVFIIFTFVSEIRNSTTSKQRC